MVCQCLRWLLIVAGVAMLVAAIFPVFAMLPLSDGMSVALVSAKFLMLPVGAGCLAGAAGLSARVHRR